MFGVWQLVREVYFALFLCLATSAHARPTGPVLLSGLDARLLEEVGELAHGHRARARLDLVVVHAHDDAGVAAAEAHTRRAL